jgi:hypothetical protein
LETFSRVAGDFPTALETFSRLAGNFPTALETFPPVAGDFPTALERATARHSIKKRDGEETKLAALKLMPLIT